MLLTALFFVASLVYLVFWTVPVQRWVHLLSSRTMHYPPVSWTHPFQHQLKCITVLPTGQSWHFLNRGSLFHNECSLCQVDIKLAVLWPSLILITNEPLSKINSFRDTVASGSTSPPCPRPQLTLRGRYEACLITTGYLKCSCRWSTYSHILGNWSISAWNSIIYKLATMKAENYP